jgi:hypothetical protein
LHRAAAQGRITVECGRHADAGDGSDRQATSGAGIAEIKRARRLSKSSDPDTVNPPGLLTDTLDAGAKHTHGLGGSQHVLAFQQARNIGRAHGHGAQDQGPVGDRFVAGNAGAPLQGPAPAAG